MENHKKVIMWGAMLTTIIVIPLIIYFFFISPETPPPVSPTKLPQNKTDLTTRQDAAKAEEPIKESAPEPTLNVSLNESDETVKNLLEACSTYPEFAQWLQNKDLVRRFVAVVDNIANGESPAPHLSFLLPHGNFQVITQLKDVYIDPISYKRYNSFTNIITSLPRRKLVTIYWHLMPLIEEAYKELGYPEKQFEDTLFQAINTLLKTPLSTGQIKLEEKVTTYAYADPNLEQLNNAQKHLLRMGPQNIKKIQDLLKEFLVILKEKQ
jgi:hypothetical protein